MTDLSPIVQVFDEAAEAYDNVGVEFFRPIAAELVRAVAPQPGEHVLDAGCGTGAVLAPVAEAVGPSGYVTGIDLAPGMVARSRATTTGLDQVVVELGDAQDPAYPAGSFDLITSGLVLFFLPDPPAALTAYRKLLKPQGRLGFSCFAQQDPRYAQALKIMARFADAPPERRYHPMFDSAESLREAVLAAGYAAVEVREAEVGSAFNDAAHLYEWIGSHAGRQLVDLIPVERRSSPSRRSPPS
ncbi:class I SAM-dependent methyltransferase [Paractinoplanes durhamensis]|uniref:class I SAM-dependent methyltransferase n=1 Tax=Paractinoplanes durhamensis TaxID=113563 RepID=UPI0036388397